MAAIYDNPYQYDNALTYDGEIVDSALGAEHEASIETQSSGASVFWETPSVQVIVQRRN